MTRLSTIFGQVYLTSALLTFVATFLPLWSSPEVESFDTMNLCSRSRGSASCWPCCW